VASTWDVAQRRFPELAVSTPRLHVRRLEPEDAKAVSEIFTDRLTRRWLPFPVADAPIDGGAWCDEIAEERRSSGVGDHYGVVRRDDDIVIGSVWAKRTDWAARSTELVYAMTPGARGEGYATEAVLAVAMALLRGHGFHRVELRTVPGNAASRRVAEKAGFHYEGRLRDSAYVHSGRVDLEMWSLVTADLR
jgi:RimJ/RimL family protein N-acetyltransferase